VNTPYYIKVKWTDVTRSYTSSIQKILGVHTATGGFLAFCAVLALIALFAWLGFRRSQQREQTHEAMEVATQWTAVGAFALLPVAGVLLAVIASGAFEIRYVIEFTLGTTICLAAGLVAIVRGQALRTTLLAAGCILAVVLFGKRVSQDAVDRVRLEQVAGAALARQTLMTDKEEFLWLHAFYGTGSGAANAVWVADLRREVAATRSDNVDRTMINLRTMAGLPVISYDEAISGVGQRRLIVSEESNPPNWLPAALIASGMQLTLMKTKGVNATDPVRVYETQALHELTSR